MFVEDGMLYPSSTADLSGGLSPQSVVIERRETELLCTAVRKPMRAATWIVKEVQYNRALLRLLLFYFKKINVFLQMQYDLARSPCLPLCMWLAFHQSMNEEREQKLLLPLEYVHGYSLWCHIFLQRYYILSTLDEFPHSGLQSIPQYS
jgi:hypothetical protein